MYRLALVRRRNQNLIEDLVLNLVDDLVEASDMPAGPLYARPELPIRFSIRLDRRGADLEDVLRDGRGRKCAQIAGALKTIP